MHGAHSVWITFVNAVLSDKLGKFSVRRLSNIFIKHFHTCEIGLTNAMACSDWNSEWTFVTFVFQTVYFTKQCKDGLAKLMTSKNV